MPISSHYPPSSFQCLPRSGISIVHPNVRIPHLQELFQVPPVPFFNHQEHIHLPEILTSWCCPVFMLPTLCSAESAVMLWVVNKRKSNSKSLKLQREYLTSGSRTEEFKGLSTSGIDLRLGLWFHFSAVFLVLFLSVGFFLWLIPIIQSQKATSVPGDTTIYHSIPRKRGPLLPDVSKMPELHL